MKRRKVTFEQVDFWFTRIFVTVGVLWVLFVIVRLVWEVTR